MTADVVAAIGLYAALATSASAQTGNEPFSATVDGRPRATLVVSEPAEGSRGSSREASDQMAVELVRDWVARITGAQLEIAASATGPAIYIGASAVAQGLDPGGGQALSIRVDEDRILLAGADPEGTVRAAAILLESVGCRWFMEGDLGRVHPVSATLVFPPMSLDAEPGFRMRRMWGGNGWAGDTLWKRWHGLGGERFETGHAWDLFNDTDFAEHPEWFRMDREGRRVQGPWLNTGNPGLREAFAERVAAATVPGSHVSISPPDAHLFDNSRDSRRYDDSTDIDPSSGRVSMTNRFMHFANEIARRLATTHPDSVLGHYAYSDYSEPPTLIDALEPNLCIWLAPIRYSRFHRIGSPLSPSRQRLERAIDGWARVATQLGYREYNYNLAEAMTPYSKVSTWSHDIPYLARRGFVGLNLESFATWNLSLPTLYLSARLSWDPFADPQQILEDLYLRFYGAAAAPMRQYWRELDAAWQGLPTESGSIYSLHLVFAPDRLRRLQAHLRRAADAVREDPTLSARVAMAEDGLANAADFMTIRQALHDGRIPEAKRTYDEWLARADRAIARGIGYSYTRTYLRRFVGRTVNRLAESWQRHSADGAKLVVLDDEMRLGYEADLLAQGVARPFEATIDESGWAPVRTYSETLDQQGLPDRLELMWYRTSFELEDPAAQRTALLFATIDGESSVWVNGRLVGYKGPNERHSTSRFPALEPFEVDITSVAQPGRNVVAIRVDHSSLRELNLGGVIAPVYLVRSTATTSRPRLP